MMRNFLYGWVRSILVLAGVVSVIISSAHADEFGQLQVRIDEKVIYCAAQLNIDETTFSDAMKDGIPVATVWNVQVKKVRDYWLNKNIAEITVIRRAEPDLLTRSWLLVDESSGISRRVYAIQDAINFLSGLEDFPVLDRSLLLSETVYRASVSVEVHVGNIDEAWWSGIWESTVADMDKDFSLP